MSNNKDSQASRDEATAFQILSSVLGTTVSHADNNGLNSYPDGRWSSRGRLGFVEVTTPPDKKHMAAWARANQKGEPFFENGVTPLNLGELHTTLNSLLRDTWATENIEKLRRVEADCRHLYLHARSFRIYDEFCRLSDTYSDQPAEPVEDLDLPNGLDAVWFQGRAKPSGDVPESVTIQVASFSLAEGWQRYSVQIQEKDLPPAPPLPGCTHR